MSDSTDQGFAQRENVFDQIISMTDGSKLIPFGNTPEYGQFVVTGPGPESSIYRLGYCVQIRKGRGKLGTDLVFLRHADGSLRTHENQCFFAVTKGQEEMIHQVYARMPEDEIAPDGYADSNGVREKGFIIEHPASKPSSEAHSVLITITKGKNGTLH